MAGGKWGGAMFYARFALLPLACLFGVGMIGFRFSLGVTSGIIAKEDTRLDPLLEREAANMKATSLIGGRTAAALRNVAPSPAAPVVAPLNAPPLPAPSATVVTAAGTGEIKPGMLQAVAGEAPKRLI
jgi:hypothetical protein